MASAYEKKFAEMKKYIPFLESMIKRLESTNALSANPRQAQLDKIRSLRDLLMDKNKRMKMENLLKCEQVLINLYSKVEQKASVPKEKLPESQSPNSSKENFDSARSKLKTLSSKLLKDTDTLPEIARASEIEEVCTPGSKEPALFQRRPNKHSPSPTTSQENKSMSPHMSKSKKKYTRILVSPDSSPRRRNDKSLNKENAMYTRRSPRRSPKRPHSPVNKKSDRSKSPKGSIRNKNLKDFNITLKVPQESLNSLNTKDILSRIINCSDGDVDIKTLRELRTQILGELKQTGGNDDISDLILKSYKNKKIKEKRQEEIEEGELSDSESEAIENIYGSVVIVDENKKTDSHTTTSKEEPRKIQICLVFNSALDEKSKQNEEAEKAVDSSDFQIYSANETEKQLLEERKNEISQKLLKESEYVKELIKEESSSLNKPVSQIITADDGDDFNTIQETVKNNHKRDNKHETFQNIANLKDVSISDSSKRSTIVDLRNNDSDQKDIEIIHLKDELCKKSDNLTNTILESTKSFRANFYKPLNDEETEEIKSSSRGETEYISNKDCVNIANTENNSSAIVSATLDRQDDAVQIPLLNEPSVEEAIADKDVVSQIDILQALKNEILSESMNIQSPEIETPSLHQPKLIKVSKNGDLMPRKRISIEKYKEKSIPSPFVSLQDSRLFMSKEESNRKQSLKLTDKECERFQLPVKSLVDNISSEEEEEPSEITTDEIYSDLAPKSPDNEIDLNLDQTQPIIIPSDPVKVVNHESTQWDIDMRELPLISPNTSNINCKLATSQHSDIKLTSNEKTSTDSRTWDEINQTIKDSPNSVNSDKQQGPYPNVVHNLLPSTPNRNPSMTPNSRTYEMTPNYQPFESGDSDSSRKHVYASSFGFYEGNDSRGQSNGTHNLWGNGTNRRKSRWAENDEVFSKRDEDSRGSNSQKDSSYSISYNHDKYKKSGNPKYNPENRMESPRPLLSLFGRHDGPNVNNFRKLDPINPLGSDLNRLECPTTPSHPFGRLECPGTPAHYFGNNECPQTPIHSFGRPEPLIKPGHPFVRLECPSTPNTTFGRVDCPMTPTHSFGRTDCPPNKSYPFNRSDASHSNLFGRSEYVQSDFNKTFSKDPRLNRKQWMQDTNSKYNDRERGYKDRGFYHERSYNSYKMSYDGAESYRHYDGAESYRHDRDQNSLRNDRNRYSNLIYDQPYRSSYSRRESGEFSRDHDGFYSKNRNGNLYASNSRAKSTERESRTDFNSEQKTGRHHMKDNQRNIDFNSSDNVMAIKSYSGRSFTIDTSVNASFQEFMSKKGLQINESSFDSRRKRAASVGRDLGAYSTTSGRDLRGDKSLIRSVKSHNVTKNLFPTQSIDTKKDRFRRASSVGRDTTGRDGPSKTFQEMKDHFEQFKKKIELKQCQKTEIIEARKSEKEVSPKTTPERVLRSKKDSYEDRRGKSKSGSLPYSPTKNRRDPRMRRDDKDYKNKLRNENRYKNTYGIVYSSDNIAKGAVLGSGYGVKNYKIPKIKRVPEENETLSNENKGNKSDIAKKDTETSKKEEVTLKQKVKDSSFSKDLKVSDSEDSTSSKDTQMTDMIITRSRKKNIKKEDLKDESDLKEEVQSKDLKQALVDNSAPESETTISEKHDNECIQSKNRDENFKHIKEPNNVTDNSSTGFGSEILDLNTENITSDFVIDSINVLIANSCNEIYTPKNEDTVDFTEDIIFENMLDNITDSNQIVDRSFEDIDEVIRRDLKKTSVCENENELTTSNKDSENAEDLDSIQKPDEYEQSSMISSKNECSTINKETNSFLLSPKNHSTVVVEKNELNVTLKEDDNASRDAIVSTTEVEEDISKMAPRNTNGQPDESDISNVCSTSDNPNTENLHTSKEQSLPDSTNEVHVDDNSDVSSSHIEINSKSSVESNQKLKDTVPPIDSLGSILTLLQDKSKIKELLTMLDDDSAENEKIKKKLEKISQIVSDEDTKEDEPNKNTVKKESEDAVEVGRDFNKEKNVLDATSVTEHSAEIKNDEIVNVPKINETPTAQCTEILSEKDKENESEALTKKESIETTENVSVKKKIAGKKGKRKLSRKWKWKKRVTKSIPVKTEVTKSKLKKPSRELLKLREDIKEMFTSDDVLNATGLRMCRLAKLVDEKQTNSNDDLQASKSLVPRKLKDAKDEEQPVEKPTRKKPGPKPKPKINEDETKSRKIKTFGPKSKTKFVQKRENLDPYAFESDSLESSTFKGSDDEDSGSDPSSDSSSQSFGSTEALGEIKKKIIRKRRNVSASSLQKKKNKKPKLDEKQTDKTLHNETAVIRKATNVMDKECFTDTSYCFQSKLTIYSCRLCEYSGDDIVCHYKKQHPHTEIPLSRMDPLTTKKAIEQCARINFQIIKQIETSKYVCRFCSREFAKPKANLEAFFWHIVSMHTGEYKLPCSECVDKPCSFQLDIPPPPTENKGQLIGYVCSKCNFTQISIENLKIHVVLRHNDEHTEVFTVNLALLSNKAFSELLKQLTTLESGANQNGQPNRVLRSTRSNQSFEVSRKEDRGNDDENSNVTIEDSAIPSPSLGTVQSARKQKTKMSGGIQSKIRFESEDAVESLENIKIKKEKDNVDGELSNFGEISATPAVDGVPSSSPVVTDSQLDMPSADIVVTPHFKISYKESGAKEYVCCINGNNHYKIPLLISLKKHVQLKHKEPWDGYCFMCKVIVTSQGVHQFKDCLQHFLDKHADDFPVCEEAPDKSTQSESSDSLLTQTETISAVPKPYINVRPLAQLMSGPIEDTQCKSPLPIIENVMSLGDKSVPLPHFSPNYPIKNIKDIPKTPVVEYEEWQAEIMTKKHRVVLEAMMDRGKLIKIYKCAGRFCSFASDNVEEALMHASTHQRMGGENALCCSYCDFNTSKNGIDLVMHVFKSHGACQYCCALCFYRAAASQSVAAHIAKAHKDATKNGNILHSANVSPIAEDSSNLLSREEAVSFYLCGHSETIGDVKTTCSFRTYTAAKFCDHLYEQHTAPYSCGICSELVTTVAQLVQHMKVHNMGMYQCAWCVYGADSETDIMSHSSGKHPFKQPQAYLRVITNKDGSNGYRVLPLANMSQGKFKIPTETVTPGPPEDPVREAERSLDLEKLITHIDSVTQSQPSREDVRNDETDNLTDTNSEQYEQAQVAGPVSCSLSENADGSLEPPIAGPASPAPPVVPPTLKTEPQDEPSPTSSKDAEVIYCLDSDEEEDTSHTAAETSPRRSSIESIRSRSLSTASNADSSAEEDYVKVPKAELCRCPYCKSLFRTMAGFRSHAIACGTNAKLKDVPCPHKRCTKVLSSVQDIISHYDIHHRLHAMGSSKTYMCGICNQRFLTMVTTKKHVRLHHNTEKYVVEVIRQGLVQVYTVRPHGAMVVADRVPSKRKLSVDANKTKRFGPQDVGRLPINPILDSFVFCSLCEFSTKVRLNMVRHLQLHAERQCVPETQPVNPVPHLETNEKHFDRMVNLASSSTLNRTPDKVNRQDSVSVTIPVEAATRYPKYVPERQRYVCGAKDCTYISLDEDMLRRHWEALHPECTDYLCAHCPPFQYLDTTKPLTSARVIGHLKMHEATLYACSSCSYYHFKRQVLEKHLDSHKNAHIITVREESSVTSGAIMPPAVAPTMDLKAWQCGLCQFKCMLRPEIVEHCSKLHQSKMQFKCCYCPFRTSDVENIVKHQSNAHPTKETDVFYYFYREGSLPDDADGTPRWRKQQERMGVCEPEIKSEVGVTSTPPPTGLEPPRPAVDLNIVKQEITEDSNDEIESMDQLCKIYGQFSEPNGIKYKCSLCRVVFEDTREAMQSHLFEELKYRKWGCGLCSYKAFHKLGLNDHMTSEHRSHYQEPIQLPKNANIENWVQGHLEYQTDLIERNKENLKQQKVLVPRAEPRPLAAPPADAAEKALETEDSVKKYTVEDLEKTFGSFCTPSEMQYRCPKCNYTVREEATMREHLEGELSKIRWCCSHCASHFQTYHEAQFHCKSHAGQAARPVEAARDPAMRREWVAHVIATQKVFLHQSTPAPGPSDETKTALQLMEPDENSLLVVRYEERVPTPEQTPPAPQDSDEEKLIIDEPKMPNKNKPKSCKHCSYSTKYSKALREHTLRHYGLKPYSCGYCDYTGHRPALLAHLDQAHPGQKHSISSIQVPDRPPLNLNLKVYGKKTIADEANKLICLICEKTVLEKDSETHLHDNAEGQFAKKGDVVVKCGICLALRKDVGSLQEHYSAAHAGATIINYAYFKLQCDSRDTHHCDYCNKRFRFLMDLRSHHSAVHSTLKLKYTTTSSLPPNEEVETLKRKTSEESAQPPPKRVARKSTTKLPRVNAVARKSTTKPPGVGDQQYSFYGSKPPPADQYANVTTMMSFCNSLMPFTVKKLREIIKVDPKVVLKDIRN
ncbi:uncharacterized protein LOC101742695 [Bombyx mori]|uniref:C2H2-type domain-containing protein n=1 Tax=Bombyx mori TaxID=7091 RepID=A0A8R2G8T9_BOMMO|nr:uncharacterized protein LOC101742695 [Bombyx mori]XP_012548181.2 uncharacterized protein LOC101742695 [Bombyx mori]XP_012548182.2 uncharacterized protein LOC101742695 [Bombyx mori]